MTYDFDGKNYKAKAKDDPKDLVEVIIGDDKDLTKFQPQQKIQRWNDECNVSIRLIEDKDEEKETPTIIEENGKIKYIKSKRECHFYNLGVSAEHPEDASEMEIILKEKPATNVIEFTVVDKDVDYFYQPALTPEEISDGAQRPENVVGSYAIYAKSPKTNWTGGKEYKCGKIGHIFRPKIIDAAGTEVWGDLHIENGVLSVTIPQDFLDKAVYPVRHAAGLTFGYTTVGSSISTDQSNKARIRIGTPASSGTVTSISFYCSGGVNGQPKMRGAVFDATPSILSPETGEISLSNGYTWQTMNFTNGPAVVGGNNYYAAIEHQATLANYVDFMYDTGGTSGDSKNATITYPTWPGSWTNTTSKYSLYATYTAGGGTVNPNHLINLMGCGV